MKLINGPEAFTPGRRVHPRARPRCAGSGRPPASAPTASRAPAGSGSSSPSGSSRARRRSTPGTWTRAASAAPTARRAYTLARTLEVYETYYDVKYPGHERQAGRPLRLSPTYPRLAELGAAFGEKSGWERANWFEPNAAARRRVAAAARLGRPALVAGDRRRAPRLPGDAPRSSTRRRSPRSRSRARAPPDFLETLCANRVARDVGAITYTSMLNTRGGIECDFTVTRLDDRALPDRHRHRVRPARPRVDPRSTRPAASPSRTSPPPTPASASGARRRARSCSRSRRRRSTSATCARASSRSGTCPCLALRVTYVGELGWELYCPMEFGLALVGRDLGAGPRARPRCRRLQGDRLAPAREGLPRLELRHHARRHAVRGRPRVRGQARQGRLHRPRGAARGAGARAAALLPRARRSARRRSRLGAGARRGRSRRPRHERRLRLLGRALDRLRLPAGRARASRGSRSRSRSSASGSRARSRRSRSSTRPASASAR